MACRFAKVSEEIEEGFFYLSDLVKLILKQLSPSGSLESGGYIYLDASRLGMYPPLFTYPSGDSCILFQVHLLYWDCNLSSTYLPPSNWCS